MPTASKTIYKLTHSNLLVWKGSVDGTTLTIKHGVDGGNLQTESIKFQSREGAELDLSRRAKVKIDRQGYSETIPSTIPQLPMLASPYKPATLPDVLYIQPKLDGIRCVATRDTMCSRRNEPITCLPHIRNDLSRLSPGIKLDGELHNPSLSFQEQLSLVKRNEIHKESHRIKYYVFDLQDPEIPFTERYAILSALFAVHNFSHLELVPTELIYKHQIEQAMKQNYSHIEGGIIRDPQLPYEFNRRHPQLQKYKWNTTEECQIIDIIAAEKGREEGAAIFICELDGVQFKVRPKMDLYTRRTVYQIRRSIIGQYTRVTYDSLSDSGVPLKPRAEGYFKEPTGSQ